MKSKFLHLPSLLIFFALATTGWTEGTIVLQPNDTMLTVLQHQLGQPVEFRMKSGEKLGGKLEKLNEKLAHLTQLIGAEYFDAVVVRAKAK